MPKNTYQKISQKDKERLREKYNRGEDFVHLARLVENMHTFLNPDQNGRSGMTLEKVCFNKLKREIELSSSEMPRMGESRDESCASLLTRRRYILVWKR